MNIAIWIIAICSLIRIIQNGIQLLFMFSNKRITDTQSKVVTDRFFESIKKTEAHEDTLERFMTELGDKLREVDDGK